MSEANISLSEKPVVEKLKRPPGIWSVSWKRFAANRFALVGLIVLAVFILCAIFAKWIAPYDPSRIDMMFPNLPAGRGIIC